MALALSIRIDADGKAAIVESKRVGDELGKIGEKGKRGGAQAADGLRRTDQAAAAATRTVGRLFAAFAVAGALKSVLSVTAEFQKLNAQLVTVTGSQAAANAQFKILQEFAAKTPFQLNEVVGAFVKMKALGLDPSEKAIASFGNTASAMGKSLNQFIEAVADASTSEFERLKEFGIKAKQEGDRVSLTFQGMTTTIGNNAQEITKYLQDIGENQFAGAMAREADTLGGAWSNLQDSAAQLANAIGTVLAPTVITIARALSDATAETAGFIEYLGKLITFDVSALEESNTQIERTSQRVIDLQRHIELLKTGGTKFGNLEELNRQLKVAEFAADEARKDQEKLLNSIKDTGEESDRTAPKIGGLSKELKKAAEAARDYIDSLIEQRELLGLSAEETLRYKAAQEAAKVSTSALADEIIKESEALIESTKRREEYTAALKESRRAEDEHREILMEGEEARRSLAQVNEQYAAILGGPVARANAQHKADLAEIRILEEQLRASGNLTQTQLQALATARTAATELHKRELAEIAYESDRTAQDIDRAWQQASDSIADAIGDFATGGIESFEDFADAVKDIAKRLVSDLISTFARNLFGGQGGGGFNLSSLFSGGGGAGGGGGFLNTVLGGIGSFLGLGGTAAAGGITAAAGTATGVAGTAATAGFTGGANAAAAAGGGGAFSGIGSMLSNPVTWIIAGMMVNQSLYGEGWRVGGGSTTLPNGERVSGGGDISGLGRFVTGGPFGPEGFDSFLQGLGLSGSAASLISGSSLHTRLFGRKKPRLTDGETSFGFGPDGVTGSERYRTYEQGGVFSSSRRRWHDFDLSEGSQDYGEMVFAQLRQTMEDAATQLGSEAPENFQAAMRIIQKFNKKGEVESTKIFVDVLGRSFEAASEEEALTRLGAEAIIATIDASMGGVAEAIGDSIAGAAESGGASGGSRLGDTVLGDLKSAAIRGEASAIAERWRDDAYKLMEGAQFLLSAASDINAGFALLGADSSLTEIADLTEDLAKEGETLLQTYQRMVTATKLFDDALALSGITIDETREYVVRLATDIADAAGGLDRASQLWNTYFNEFFSDTELAQVRLDAANARRRTALEELGLDENISNEDFRTAFEDAMASGTLTAEMYNTWLLASEAISNANAAQAAYNETLEDAAEVNYEAIDAMQDHVNALREARDEYASYAAGLRRELEGMGLTEFQLEMRDISEWTQESTQRLNDLARAAGYAAANEEDLAIVHQIAAQRAAEAIARLTNSARTLVEQLYGGGSGDNGQTLIDNTQNYIDTSLAGINEIGAATNQLYQSQLAGIQSIQAYLDAQLLGDTSSLTPAEQLAEARRQFEAAFQAALGGDADALNDITRLADILLRQGRAFDPSDYPELEAFVRGLLGQLTQIVPVDGTGPGGTNPGGVGTGAGTVGGVVGQVLDGTAQQVAEDRAALVAELVNMVRDLMEATGQSLSEVAASIGLNVQDFISELGINLSDLTVETTLQLAALSSRLGISLTELAGQVGVDLGELADAQSLLNQALGQTIEGLPEEDRRVLQPLFQNIANATTAADANAAIAALTSAGNTIGGDTAAALQPFLSGINITTEIGTANGHLNTLVTQGIDQVSALFDIRDHLAAGGGGGSGIPNPGTGGGGGLPGGGLPTVGSTTLLFTPSEGDAQVVAALRGLREDVQQLQTIAAGAGSQTVAAIQGEQAKKLRDAERARDMALVSRQAR